MPHSFEFTNNLSPAQSNALRGHTVVLFDGVCALCNRTIRFLIQRDRTAQLVFIPLDTPLARMLLSRHPHLPQTLAEIKSVIVLQHLFTPREQALERTTAVLAGMSALPAPWPIFAVALRIIPRPLRDLGYRFIAHFRYRLFGRFDTCPIPTPAERSRILSTG